MAKAIADAFGIMTIEPHVGFKFLGEKLAWYSRQACEAAGPAQPYRSLSRRERVELLSRHSLCVLFGGEESSGSLVGDYVKDKHAITVSAMFAEMAGFYKLQGKTLMQRLEEIFVRYGYAREETISLGYAGSAGNDVIRAIMAELRARPPQQFCGRPVIAAIKGSACPWRRSLQGCFKTFFSLCFFFQQKSQGVIRETGISEGRGVHGLYY